MAGSGSGKNLGSVLAKAAGAGVAAIPGGLEQEKQQKLQTLKLALDLKQGLAAEQMQQQQMQQGLLISEQRKQNLELGRINLQKANLDLQLATKNMAGIESPEEALANELNAIQQKASLLSGLSGQVPPSVKISLGGGVGISRAAAPKATGEGVQGGGGPKPVSSTSYFNQAVDNIETRIKTNDQKMVANRKMVEELAPDRRPADKVRFDKLNAEYETLKKQKDNYFNSFAGQSAGLAADLRYYFEGVVDPDTQLEINELKLAIESGELDPSMLTEEDFTALSARGISAEAVKKAIGWSGK